MERLNKSLGWFVVLALLLHWLFLKFPIPEGWRRATVAERKKPADEIEVAPYPTQDKPRARTSLAENQEKTKKKADFSGEFKNRVKKQTRSPIQGPFREGHRLSSGIPESSEKGAEGVPTPSLKDLLSLGSNPYDLRKQVEEGSETVLNTDPVRYASFFNRLADEIYDPWVRYAREAVHDIYLMGQKLDSTTYVTRLQIELDSQGKVVAITTLQSSGIDSLDEASRKAFWSTEPFPHPPEGLMDEAGEVKFVYEFHFEVKNSSFNILPWAI